MELTVIVPALNEEKNIIDAINNIREALDSYGIKGELIVIDDGSKDKTQELVRLAMQKDSRIRMIKHAKTEGIGGSFWDGVDNAYGNTIVLIPGDNENIPAETLRYYKLLEHVDMVIPFVFNKEVRPLFRNALSFIYRFIINSTFTVNFNYTNGTVLYRKSILQEIDYRSKGFFFQVDILVRTVKKGYLFAEVPYKLGLRQQGLSKAISFPSLSQVIKGYLRLVKDYYFKNRINNKECFSTDSLTAIRRDAKRN
jgi:dolichol-phosphate mannosyltransferase